MGWTANTIGSQSSARLPAGRFASPSCTYGSPVIDHRPRCQRSVAPIVTAGLKTGSISRTSTRTCAAAAKLPVAMLYKASTPPP